MDGHPSSYSDCEKEIGIYIDQDLTFSKHTSMAVNKVNKATAITRTFDYIYKDIFMQIYISKLSYAHSWTMPTQYGIHI